MKRLIALFLILAPLASHAALTVQNHKVTYDDCQRSASIIQGAIEARDEVDFDTVVQTLQRDEYKKIDGFTAMLPMTKDYLKQVFFNNLVNTTAFQTECQTLVGKEPPRSI